MYFPGKSINCEPIHEVQDWQKVRSLIRAMRRGDDIPAVIVDNGVMLTGTHRVAALEIGQELSYRFDKQLKSRVRVKKLSSLEESVIDKINAFVANDEYDLLDDFLNKESYYFE